MQRPSKRRGKLLNNDQELAIVEMVVANNAVKLHEIQSELWRTMRYLTISIASASQPLRGHCPNTECG